MALCTRRSECEGEKTQGGAGGGGKDCEMEAVKSVGGFQLQQKG